MRGTGSWTSTPNSSPTTSAHSSPAATSHRSLLTSTERLPAVVLEPAAQKFVDALAGAGGPPVYTLSPTDLTTGPAPAVRADVSQPAGAAKFRDVDNEMACGTSEPRRNSS